MWAGLMAVTMADSTAVLTVVYWADLMVPKRVQKSAEQTGSTRADHWAAWMAGCSVVLLVVQMVPLSVDSMV